MLRARSYTRSAFGEVSERLKELVSKTSSGLVLLVSSNLTLSVEQRLGVLLTEGGRPFLWCVQRLLAVRAVSQAPAICASPLRTHAD